jgi:predicted transcriptional regulator of viral defense system
MDASLLRSRIGSDEFDYQMLLDALSDYRQPRVKITQLLKKGVITRVKKGLYVFDAPYRQKPVSREMLANMIYGPSYISLDYALQWHSLIPEAVHTVTSVTSGRSRTFATPFGAFSYRHIPLRAYQVGMDRVALDDGKAFLIATPEKALADKIAAARGINIRTIAELEVHLEENMRVDMEELKKLDPERLATIAEYMGSRKVKLLCRLVSRLRGPEGGAL